MKFHNIISTMRLTLRFRDTYFTNNVLETKILEIYFTNLDLRERETKRALWCCRICCGKLVIFHSLPNHHISDSWCNSLLPSRPTKERRKLHLLCSPTLCLHDVGREPNDGCSKYSPRFPHGNHHRCWDSRCYDFEWRFLSLAG